MEKPVEDIVGDQATGGSWDSSNSTGEEAAEGWDKNTGGSSTHTMESLESTSELSIEHEIHTEFRFKTEFKHLSVLGRGVFGRVVLCKDIFDHQQYAVKLLPPAEARIKDVLNFTKIEHPRIVRYFNAWIEQVHLITPDSDTLFIQMELCEKTLAAEIFERMCISSARSARIFGQILEGVCFIHEQNIAHGDLSSAAIFLKNKEVKIGDFGFCRFVDIDHLNNKFPGYYYYKDVCQGTNDKEKDMFSLGIILFELFYFFDTKSHRYKVLDKFRRTRELPTSFLRARPFEASMVKAMTSSEGRLSAHEALNLWRERPVKKDKKSF